MIHVPLALLIQFLFSLAGFGLLAGAVAAILVFAMREITQAEYRWIEANGGLREAMPWWKGMDLTLWNSHSLEDVMLPAVAVLVVLTAFHYSKHMKAIWALTLSGLS